MTAPDRLQRWRERRKLTQLELATKLKVRPETIARWEAGSSMPSLSNAVDIERVTGISYRSWLSGGPV